MEEYRVEIKVKNNLLIRKIEKAGYKSVGEFCRLNNMMGQASQLGDIINLKASPLRSDGGWQSVILKCSDIIGCAPEDFFTDIQLKTILKSNKRSVQVNEAEMKFMLEQSSTKLLDEVIEFDEKKKYLDKSLTTLASREQRVIDLRFGLNGEKEHSLEEMAQIMGVSRERVRQIEAKSIRKLRHPDRCRELHQLMRNDYDT